MADLGNLWFSLGVKDNTQKEIDAAIKRIEKLEAKMKLGIDKTALRTAITTYLKTQQFKAKITPELPKSAGKVMLEANKVSIRKSINDALKDTFTAKVKVVVEKASVQEAVKAAFAQAGLRYNTSASDVRAQRILEIQARMAQRAAINQEQLAAAHSRAQRAAALQAATTERLNRGMSNSWKLSGQLANQIANLYSIYALERFGSALVQIGGEFQKQRIALTAMLGDSGKAQKIFDQIRGLAVESPYTFMDLSGFTKQLAAFSVPYEELYETTKRLADISSGLGVDMGRIILAYGQVRSAAFLRGTEVRQFTEAGIPILDALAKKFSELEGRVVSVGDVFDKISRREVPFEMVRDVLWEMTDAGGQFYNMQAVLTESLSGKYDKLKDSLQIMIGDMAEASSGLIGGTLDMLTALTGKWKEIGAVIVTVSTAVGTYKAAQAAANIVTAQSAVVTRYAAISHATLSKGQITTLATTRALSLGMAKLNALWKAFNATVLMNPYAWAAAAVAGLAYVVYNLATATTAAESAQAAFNKTLEDTKSKVDGWKNDVGELVRTIQGADNTDLQKQLAFDELKRIAPALTETYSTIKDIENADLSGITRNINALGDERNVDILRAQKEILQEYIRMASDRTMWGSYQLKGLTKTLQDDFGIEGDFGWSYDTYANAAQQALNKITGELYKLADAKERASVPTTFDVKVADEDYRDALEKFTLLSDFAAAMKREAEGSISPSVDGSEAKAGTDELIREIESRLAAMEGIPLSVEQQKAKTELEEMLDYMRRWKEMGTVKGVFTIPLFFQARLDSAENALNEAKKQFNYITGRYEEVNKSQGTLAENRSEAYRKWQEAEKAYEKARKASNLRDKNGNIIWGEEEQKKELKRFQDDAKEWKKAYEALGGKSSTSRSGSDPVTEMWKERIELIEKALDAYGKWSELEGNDAAAKRVTDNPIYAPVRSYLEAGLDEPEKIWEEILGKVKDKELGLRLRFMIDESTREAERRAVDEKMESIRKYVEETTRRWDTFKELSDATGNATLAGQIVFGGAMQSGSLGEELRKRVTEALEGSGITFDAAIGMNEDELERNGIGALSELVEAYRDNMRKMKEEQISNLADLISSHKDYAQQIEDIESKLQKDLADIESRRSDMEAVGMDVDRLVAQRKKNADEEKSAVLLEQFKEESGWEAVFDDLSRVSDATLSMMTEGIERFATETGLSVDETKELVEALRKLREESISRNPLKGIATSIGDIRKWRKALSDSKTDEDRRRAEDGLAAAQDDLMKSVEGAISGFESLNNVLGGVSEMFEALGANGLSGFTDIFGGALSGASSGMSSFNSIGSLLGLTGSALSSFGFIGMGVGALTSVVSEVAGWHDEKLNSAIEASQERVESLQAAYERMGSAIERSFGIGEDAAGRAIASYKQLERQVEAAGSEMSSYNSVLYSLLEDGWDDTLKSLKGRTGFGQRGLYVDLLNLGASTGFEDPNIYTAQYASLIAQRSELQKQLSAEEGKKESDQQAIADYQQQLAELNEQVTYFVQDTVESLYGMDLQDWGSQLSDTLVEAFRNGEDAAAAFESTASDLLAQVANNIVRIGILEPAMKKLSETLFGTMDENGNYSGGMIDLNDLGSTDAMNDAIAYVGEWFNTEGKALAEASDTLLSGIDEATGGLLSAGGDGGGGGKTVQGSSYSEETNNLLLSYVNAVRADVSVERAILESLSGDQIPQITSIADAQLQQLKQITANTGRNADLAEEIRDLVKSAKTGKGTGFYIR